MRPLVLIAFVAAGLAAPLPAVAQTINSEPTVTNVPPPAESRPAAAKSAAATSAPRVHQASRRAHADRDCRFCLDLPTDIQVMKCAEKFRPHGKS